MNEKQIRDYCEKLKLGDDLTQYVVNANNLYESLNVKRDFGNLNFVDAIHDRLSNTAFKTLTEREKFLMVLE